MVTCARENWCVKGPEELEVPASLGDSQRLSRFECVISRYRNSVSEIVRDRNREPIHGRQQKLGRFPEYLREKCGYSNFRNCEFLEDVT